MKRRKGLSIFLILLLAFALGCKGERWDLSVANQSSRRIKDFRLEFDGLRSLGGVLGAHTHMIQHGIGTPIPDIGHAVWLDEQGLEIRKELDLASNVPRNYSGGLLYIAIQESWEVTISFIPAQERRRFAGVSR